MIVDMEMIENLQASITKAQVFVEVESVKLAEEIVAKHNLKHTIELEQMEYAIPLFTADNAVEVKVHDLPPRMPNDLIVKQLLGYGEVLSIKNGVWKEYFPGKANGIRIFRMKIRKPIPSYITVEGETAYVMYRNQIRTCKHCTRELHIGKTCGVQANRLQCQRPVNSSTSPIRCFTIHRTTDTVYNFKHTATIYCTNKQNKNTCREAKTRPDSEPST